MDNKRDRGLHNPNGTMSKHAIYPFFTPVKSERGKRVYISGPMTGLPNDNVVAFSMAAELLRASGYSVCNPIDTSVWLGSLSHQDYLRFDFLRVLEADFLVALDGWAHSKGALAEIFVALRIGTKVWHWDSFEDYNQITEAELLSALALEHA